MSIQSKPEHWPTCHHVGGRVWRGGGVLTVLTICGFVAACSQLPAMPRSSDSDPDSGASEATVSAAAFKNQRPVPAPNAVMRHSVENPALARPAMLGDDPVVVPSPEAGQTTKPYKEVAQQFQVPSFRLPEATVSPPTTRRFGSGAGLGTGGVALLLPLSGKHAALGQSMLWATQMAVFDAAGESFTLLPYDTGGTPEMARQAARQARADGARLILGPIFAESVRAVKSVLADSGINILAFSTDRSVVGDNVYLLGFVPRNEVERVVAYALSRDYQRLAALVPNSDYGTRIVQALGEAAQRLGATVVRVARYESTGADYASLVRQFADYDARRLALQEYRAELLAQDHDAARATLEQLETLETLGDPPFDAVLLPEGGARLKELATLLAFYDVDPKTVRFLGTALWDDPSLSAEPALIGGWYAAAPLEVRDNFGRRFKDLFGHAPVHLVAMAYDAVSLAAVLDRKGGGYSASSLTAGNGFAGVNGIFRLLPTGLTQRGLAVLEITRSGRRVKSPAPNNFSFSRR